MADSLMNIPESSRHHHSADEISCSLRRLLWPDIPDHIWKRPDWQWQNRLTGRHGLELLLPHLLEADHRSRLNGDSDRKNSSKKIEQIISKLTHLLETYPWSATPYYISLANREPFDPAWITGYQTTESILQQPKDPILLQAVPSIQELSHQLKSEREEEKRASHEAASLYSPDPLAERRHSPVPGLIHRYRDRCLLLVSRLCPLLCRHCNRKRTWIRDRNEAILSWMALERAVNYIKKHPGIREVLLSGGDPLTLNRNRLKQILTAIREIQHVEVVRIGTRLPVTLPYAIDEDLCSMLSQFRPIWINTHFNHVREITEDAARACEMLQMAGLAVSNQAVLLKGVNDSYEQIRQLCTRLQAIMVRPYYLFQCDMVTGTAHFRTPLSTGISIMKQLWGDTGGMAIPRFAIDLPQGQGKAVIAPSSLLAYDKGKALVETFDGKQVEYTDP